VTALTIVENFDVLEERCAGLRPYGEVQDEVFKGKEAESWLEHGFLITFQQAWQGYDSPSPPRPQYQ
jgi:hypothetical protein